MKYDEKDVKYTGNLSSMWEFFFNTNIFYFGYLCV